MITAVPPSPVEFEAGARQHFSFLVNAHGFKQAKPPAVLPQMFNVCFAKPGVLVAVIGYSYGFALDVVLCQCALDGSVKERISQGLLMRLRTPELLQPRFGGDRGQLEQMRFGAAALPLCAGDVLSGDFSILPAVRALEQQLRAESEAAFHAQELSRAATQASEAFYAGQYTRVLTLLEPLEPHLSKAQSSMLALARKRK